MKSSGPCYLCGCEVWLPDALMTAALHSTRISFWCAYGHEQHFKDVSKEVREEEVPEDEVVTKNDGNVTHLEFKK